MIELTLSRLADEVWAWQKATFGSRITINGALNKLRDECEEVQAAFKDYHAWHALDQIREELADCFFMLVQLGGLITDDYEGCGLLFEWLADDEPDMPLVCVGRLKAHALWSDQWTGLLLAKAAWLDACASLGSLTKMPDVIAAKLAKNKERTWPAEPAENGTFSHVKVEADG